ncbi:MAG: hypothetical protein A3E80_06330 [Chlamydiae bacterium RIFCSPHIGHO2_12_FULL_49_9]|nr:MAG: hypothetical protein A3E80_06330 [Chlamydiae bacterium RIFCSPHIGHO2_12_FULL_49_9]
MIREAEMRRARQKVGTAPWAQLQASLAPGAPPSSILLVRHQADGSCPLAERVDILRLAERVVIMFLWF